MLHLVHQVNNKPLIVALSIAFVLHFLFTLTYQIDFEWTSPDSKRINISITDPEIRTIATDTTAVEPKPDAQPGQQSSPDKTKVTSVAAKSDHLDGGQWGIAKKMTRQEYLQRIFVDGLDAQMVVNPKTHSLSFAVPEGFNDSKPISCSEGVRNYAFLNCPVDGLQISRIRIEDNYATLEPLLVMPSTRVLQLALSTPTNPQWYNDIERDYEGWTHLAGLPTLSVAFD